MVQIKGHAPAHPDPSKHRVDYPLFQRRHLRRNKIFHKSYRGTRHQVEIEKFISVWMRILDIEESVQGWSAHSDSFCCPATTSPSQMVPWPRIRARCHKPLITCCEGASANDHRARTHEHADLHSDGCNSQERKA